MKEKNYLILSQIFRIIFELDDNENVENIRKLNEIKWDSIANVTLATAIESELNIKIDISEMDRFTSFKSIELLINEKIND
jgi:acyl carrier protein